KHTRRYLKEEQYFPGPVIDRANRDRWQEDGGLSLYNRAFGEVERLINEYKPSRLSSGIKKELRKLMENEAKRYGMEKLPSYNKVK
ncbi:trimethylamine methyltransferase family protein, partial [candidate division WOR-3 bacterium]|nr:trimethylamine methyltransferase family protein [candidate division WOR-3 bacterium]